jgi:uncharacterized membrane protein
MNNFVLGMIILVALQLWLPFGRRYHNAAETTYKDIKPILNNRCAQCHNQNWPDKNWMDYDTAFKNKDKIKLRLQNQTMPPGNNTQMTDDERKTVIKWVDDGGKK